MAQVKQRPPRMRNRSTLSCEACRARKARCDRKQPCAGCVRWNVEKCVYSTQPDSSKKADDSNEHGELPTSATAAKRVAHPQRRLLPLRPSATILPKQTTIPPPTESAAETEDSKSGAADGIYVWRTTPLASIFIGVPSSANATKDGQMCRGSDNTQSAAPGEQSLFPGLEGTMGPVRGAFYKNRYIGQSHWMYVWPLYPPALVIVGTEMLAEQESWRLFQECKSLARVIKSQQPPSSVVLGCTDVGYHLPSKILANNFLDAYLETFETVHRVFIVPDFRRDFDAIWSRRCDDAATPPRREILIQAQLCMAIGASASEEGSSLRPYITQWLSEGCAWATHASQKQKLLPSGLQTLCLLHIAKLTCAVEADLAWIPAGSLIRTAMCMGFHIDPSMLPAMPAAEVELRRRLWTTVLELVLESSISAGAPPLLSADDVGCCLPSNCNDADLLADAGINATARAVPIMTRPPGDYTDTSAQIALAKSFKTRLGIVRTINQPSVVTATNYGDLVKLSADVDAACHQLRSDLARPGSTPFQRKYCMMALERYRFVIHVSYLTLAYHKTPGVAAEYSMSRQVCVDTALRMMYTCLTPTSDVFKASPLSTFTASTEAAFPPTHETATAESAMRSDEYFSAIVRRGGGHLRSIPLQCILILALELITRTSAETQDLAAADSGSQPLHDGSRAAGGITALQAPLSHPPGAMGQFDSLRDVELHLMLRVGSEWTARRISEAGDVCCKDHAFVALQLAIAEEQIAKRSHSSEAPAGPPKDQDAAASMNTGSCRPGDTGSRQRYCAAFQQCKDLMAERLRRSSTRILHGDNRAPSHTPGEDPCWPRAGAADRDLGLDRVRDLGPRPVGVGGLPPDRVDLFQISGQETLSSWPRGLHGDAARAGHVFNGFWMGDASDELDWDGIMDFAAF